MNSIASNEIRSKLKDLCFKNRHKPYTKRWQQPKETTVTKEKSCI